MRFNETIHWAEGLFLQPHHLQQFQWNLEQRDRTNRSLTLPYPSGVIDFELDVEALANFRVVFKRLSAIFPDGEEISMPGNAILPPLDLSQALKTPRNVIQIFLALPRRSAFDGNLVKTNETTEKRLYSLHETQVRDENSGDNEIPMILRRQNVRLTTDFADNTDLELLPLLKLRPIFREAAEVTLKLDTDYIPPFLIITADCPLFAMATELNVQIRNRRNKLLNDLSVSGYTAEALSGTTLQSVLQLQTLNCYEARLSALLSTGSFTPFGLYLELRALLGELAALQPLRDLGELAPYNHLDSAPQFHALLIHIRSMILAEGLSSYIRLDFNTLPHQTGLHVTLTDEHLVRAEAYYLAIQCDKNPRELVAAVENGDHFKLLNPSGSTSRIRGVKLTEVRYPPRFLPALSNTLWFQLQRGESQRMWSEICTERGILLDWAEELFPKLTASLFITILNREEQ